MWYRKAADRGFAWAQFNLGLEYFNGYGVPQDYVQAHWFNLALRRAEDDATRNKAVEARDFSAAKRVAQIADAQGWRGNGLRSERSRSRRSGSAYLRRGRAHAHSTGVPAIAEVSLRFFRLENNQSFQCPLPGFAFHKNSKK